jgi:hypothetical protein
MANTALPAQGKVSIETDVSPAELWPFMSDPKVPAMFSSELQEANFVDGGQPHVGSVIEGRNKNSDFQWTTMSYVVASDEPTRFSWATGDDGDPTATWTLTAEPSSLGSILSHSVVFHADKAPLAPAIEKDPDRAEEIVRGRMDKVLVNMQATIEGITALARSSQSREEHLS